jgi:hypothetical protein
LGISVTTYFDVKFYYYAVLIVLMPFLMVASLVHRLGRFGMTVDQANARGPRQRRFED